MFGGPRGTTPEDWWHEIVTGRKLDEVSVDNAWMVTMGDVLTRDYRFCTAAPWRRERTEQEAADTGDLIEPTRADQVVLG